MRGRVPAAPLPVACVSVSPCAGAFVCRPIRVRAHKHTQAWVHACTDAISLFLRMHLCAHTLSRSGGSSALSSHLCWPLQRRAAPKLDSSPLGESCSWPWARDRLSTGESVCSFDAVFAWHPCVPRDQESYHHVLDPAKGPPHSHPGPWPPRSLNTRACALSAPYLRIRRAVSVRVHRHRFLSAISLGVWLARL